MIIFNTTFQVDKSIIPQSIDYLKKEYIQKAVKSGVLQDDHVLKELQENESEGSNFSVKLTVKEIPTTNKWLKEEGNASNQALVQHFGPLIAGFSTLLEEIALDA